ncbi:MAG TPA: S8 family serine peptidase [Mycobacteriales bacterium]|nr:S8 family serine peptidase [Mycobacteriales bacterium]
MRRNRACLHRIAVVVCVLGLVAPAPPVSAAPKGDPLRARQWSHDRVRVTEAWKHSTGRGAVVALLDSGVDLAHPDRPHHLLIPRGADVIDPDGCIDSRCRADGPRDLSGHGTAVAGVVAARTGNGEGIAGIAPDARVMPIRIVSPNAPASFAALARGIRLAVDHGADVIGVWVAFPELPFELSSRGISGETLNDQPTGAAAEVFASVEYAWARGALVIGTAGNGFPSPSLVVPSGPPSGPGKPECGIPAIHPLALCVGAVDRADRHTYYSDFRPLRPDMLMVGPSGNDVTGGFLPPDAAPCADRVVTTALTGSTRACPGDLPAGYTTISGTSGAAAYVVGVATLLAAQGRTNVQILEALRTTAVDLGAPGTDSLYGRGRVDALAAVRAPR